MLHWLCDFDYALILNFYMSAIPIIVNCLSQGKSELNITV